MLISSMSGMTYNLMLAPEDKFFEKLLMVTLFVGGAFARNMLRGSRRRTVLSYFVLLEMSGLGFKPLARV